MISKNNNGSLEEKAGKISGNAGKKIEKIVLTGGPCAGKTTAQSWIASNLEKIGYRVLFVPESATELMGGGVLPGSFNSALEYQTLQLCLQAAKERVFEDAARQMNADKVLIVCDRGQLDAAAFMPKEEFEEMARAAGTTEVLLRDDYGAVFHLVTAAKGAREYYTLANNAVRTQTPEEAAALDDGIIAAWAGHPHLRVIGNETDFRGKMQHLLKEITAYLGEPEPLEIERKFLIRFPDLARLEQIPACKKVEIIQTYLRSADGGETRVRQRGADGSYTYTLTTKKAVSPLKRVEVERRLTQQEYLEKLLEADVTRRQIRKTRYCLVWEGKYFEIDVYPFWDDQAILEIELADENENVQLPPFLSPIREVTDDPDYKNAALARIR